MKYFIKAFLKTAEALRKEVSTVAVIKDGKMLMGKRRDNGKYTAPGGHLDRGEDPLDGAVRELREESGIEAKPSDLKYIRTIKNKENGYVVHGYEYRPKKDISTSMKNDPDGEVYRWHFMDVDKIEDKDLHVPRSKGNVLLEEEKQAGLKELALAGSLLASPVAKAGNFTKTPAAKAIVREASRHKDILKHKPLAIPQTFQEKATEAVQKADKALSSSHGLKIRPNKIEKSISDGKITIRDLGKSVSADYKNVGADYSKKGIKLRGKLDENTNIELDPKNKGLSLAWNKSF